MGDDVQHRRNACEQNEADDVLEFAARVVERVVTVAMEDVRVEAELRSRCGGGVSEDCR